MVTYSLCRAEPRVRVLAPHPFLFILLALILCCRSGSAVELSDYDHYSSAPDTLASSVSSPDSLARVVGGDIFGVYWSTFGGDGQISAIDGVSMKDRADGVQDLATATYKTFQGVETAIANAAATDPLVLQWLEDIYDQLYSSSRSGDVVTKTSVANLIADLLARNQLRAYSYSGVPYQNLNVADLLALSTLNMYELLSNGGSFLSYDGTIGGGRSSLSAISASGFLGLSSLMFGNASHPIFGLDYNGADKQGSRGSWSLADINANGFRGLATLLSGVDSHRGNWVWLNQSGYEGNGSTSLMDMVGEGFLGLGSLFADTSSGSGAARLSWDYLSFNDGVSSTQMQHSTLFGFLGALGSGIQNPLARLAYLYASPDDIEFKQEEQPNMDQVKDSFFGDGEAAVNPDQIKDVAGAASSFKSSFTPPVSIADFFSTLSDGQNYIFFSQETADNLDTVNSASVASQEDFDEPDPYEGYVQGEDGLYYPSGSTVFNLYSYLEGLS